MPTRPFAMTALCLGLWAGPAAAQGNLQCQNTLVRAESGTFLLELNARNAALATWSGRTTRQFGMAWANWANAADRSEACTPVTTAVGANVYRCSVSARPCMYQ